MHDSIMVAQELIHVMRRIRRKRGSMAVKVDLEKAYDSLSWDFIRDTLPAANILENLRNVIMTCIPSPTIQELWNGESTDRNRLRNLTWSPPFPL